MAKRSNFMRLERDTYDTPASAVAPLLPHLVRRTRFVEPAAGSGALVRQLEAAGHCCVGAYDIAPRDPSVEYGDILQLTNTWPGGPDVAITNPPWERKLLHAIIDHMSVIKLSAWLLIDAGWMFTQQARAYLPYCRRIVTIGRVRWIPGTKMTSKDDACWYLFVPYGSTRPTHFYGQQEEEKP